MAFRILSDDEIALLTDNERGHYERELDIYQKRVKFVERLEALENVSIPPYKPQLKSIPIVDVIDVKPFVKPEHKLSVRAPAVKPALRVTPFKKQKPINPNMPILSKQPAIKLRHIKKSEGIQPKLPQIDKLVPPAARFEKSEIKPPVLPAIAKPDIALKAYNRPGAIRPELPRVHNLRIQANMSLGALNIDYSGIKVDMPKVKVPGMELSSFVMPEKPKYNLPKAPVHFTGIKAYKKPEIAASELPAVSKPLFNGARVYKKPEQIGVKLPVLSKLHIDTYSFEEVSRVQTKLPELSDIAPVNVTFTNPEFHPPELPAVAKPSVIVPAWGKPEQVKPILPRTLKPKIQPRIFDRPERLVPALPAVTKPVAGIKSFKNPEYKKPELPVIIKAHVAEKNFTPLEITKPNLPAVVSPRISVIPFTKTECKVTGLPLRKAIKIPDAHETLQKLFPDLFHDRNEDSKIPEGIDA